MIPLAMIFLAIIPLAMTPGGRILEAITGGAG